MAVRFLPIPGDAVASSRPQRDDIAEVVDIRAKLVTSADPADSSAAPVSHPEPCPEQEASSPRVAESPQVAASRLTQKSIKRTSKSTRGQFAAVHSDALPDELPDLNETGVRLLSRKALSAGELRRQLQRLGYPENDVEDLIRGFEERYYLDDVALARTLSEKLRDVKRASRGQIRQKLSDRLIDRGVVDQVLAELDEDEELDLLQAAAHERARKLGSLDRHVAERRLVGFLARRGWGGSQAIQAAREALDALTEHAE